ncbi:hypothetical protein [Streptomyces caeni]|uniref:hypothetical protein n=1 Tax=Streptomyces caeni TaxID=2307231 RepID=UPI0036D26B30
MAADDDEVAAVVAGAGVKIVGDVMRGGGQPLVRVAPLGVADMSVSVKVRPSARSPRRSQVRYGQPGRQ